MEHLPKYGGKLESSREEERRERRAGATYARERERQTRHRERETDATTTTTTTTTTTMTDAKEKKEEYEGTLAFSGVTDFSVLGKVTMKPSISLPNMPSPTLFKCLSGVKVKRVLGGSAAQHCMIIDSEKRLWCWGNNAKGQLGLGHTTNLSEPTLVTGDLEGKEVVGGAAGRGHSVVYLKDGTSYSFGTNKYGQLGLGSVKFSILSKKKNQQEELHTSPVKNVVVGCNAVTCGAEFTLWLQNGAVLSAGCPEYGQLGHGTDNQYNSSDSSLKMYFQPQPQPKLIGALVDKTILKIASGNSHSLALDSNGHLYSWGFGGYGRLGHKVQKDEFRPRQIEMFENRLALPLDATIACGNMTSFATIKGGQLYMWGKMKTSGDSNMYPQPLMEISGWTIRSLACGNGTFACASEKSAITWGQAQYQELAYGPKGKKSSANPAMVDALQNKLTHEVSASFGSILFLVDEKEDLSALEEWQAPEVVIQAEEPAKGGKRKGGAAKGGRKKKR